MADFSRLAGLVNRASIALLSDATATIGADTVSGIFTNQYVDALDISSTRPAFACDASDAAGIGEGTALTITSAMHGITAGAYIVRRIEPDAGMTRLILEEQ